MDCDDIKEQMLQLLKSSLWSQSGNRPDENDLIREFIEYFFSCIKKPVD